MSDVIQRENTCCFTGHRPEKLLSTEETIRQSLTEEIENAIASGYTSFISGMARGVDLWAAEIVLSMRSIHPELQLICAFPCKKDYVSRQAQLILEQADQVVFVSARYDPGCFQRRNEWMIDHSSRIIAIYNGEKGGTKNTINYAQKKGVDIHLKKFS